MEVGRAVRQLQGGSEDDRRNALYLWSGETARFNEEEQQTVRVIRFIMRKDGRGKEKTTGSKKYDTHSAPPPLVGSRLSEVSVQNSSCSFRMDQMKPTELK